MDFVLDYCPDIVKLHAIDNDLDGCISAKTLVGGHVGFAVKLATQMGGYSPTAQTSPTLALYAGVQLKSRRVCESAP